MTGGGAGERARDRARGAHCPVAGGPRERLRVHAERSAASTRTGRRARPGLPARGVASACRRAPWPPGLAWRRSAESPSWAGLYSVSWVSDFLSLIKSAEENTCWSWAGKWSEHLASRDP